MSSSLFQDLSGEKAAVESDTEDTIAQSAFYMDPSERCERKPRACPYFRTAAGGEKMPTVYFPKIKV